MGSGGHCRGRVTAVDPDAHRRLTGAGKELVLGNPRWLAGRAPGKVLPRVPGLNDGDAELASIAALLVDLGLSSLELVPHHPLGQGKYTELGASSPSPCRRLESLCANRQVRGLDRGGQRRARVGRRWLGSSRIHIYSLLFTIDRRAQTEAALSPVLRDLSRISTNHKLPIDNIG